MIVVGYAARKLTLTKNVRNEFAQPARGGKCTKAKTRKLCDVAHPVGSGPAQLMGLTERGK